MPLRAYLVLAVAGFRRYSTYRQAMAGAIFTNSVFGLLRCAVLLAVAGASAGGIAGYDEPRLLTFVWVGQGLIGVVLLWAPTELADRIRAGDVIADLLRPVDLVWQQLATDLGRAGLALFTRLVGPILVGALLFPLYAPRRMLTYPLFACSMLLGTIVCFGCRYLVNAAAYWLLDVRGPQVAWTLTSGPLGGLLFPLWLLPRPAALGLMIATPFPSLIQFPLDILVERGPVGEQLAVLCLQAGWAAVMLALCRFVQRLGERKLVLQGG
ncbi:MAG TPA: ABC-2 family transporter protein [Candidatus Methylomirabilis sp.]|nr:ABC-2 family transporter protein [Candidatus Methylomirabilis sp.]